MTNKLTDEMRERFKSAVVLLGQMLNQYAPNKDLVMKVWPQFNPFVSRVAVQHFPLRAADAFDAQEVAQAIMSGLRIKGIREVRFVRATAEAHPLAGFAIQDTLIDPFLALYRNRQHAFEGWFGGQSILMLTSFLAFLGEFYAPLTMAVTMTNLPMLLADEPKDMERHMRLTCTPALVLLFLIGHVLAGHESDVEELLPLLELVTYAIPIGERFEEPDVWYVLTA